MSHTSDSAEIYGGTSESLAAPKISARRIAQLVWKTWPFVRPMLKHLIVLFAVGLLISAGFAAGGLFAADVIGNKILVGTKLQPFQAATLLLDESYVDETASDAGDEVDQPEGVLTPGQRKVVRNRTLIAAGILLLIALPLALVLPYYFSWVWQSVNQNLRVAMVERAEHLSLQHHSQSRVGDAIFRVYQDSAMINSLLEEGIVGTLMQIYGLVVGLFFIAFFDPRIAAACVLVGLPMIWLTVKFTPRLRRRSLANRRAYSNLTSRLQESLTAIKVVKANRAEGRFLARFNADSHRALDAALAIRMDMTVLSFSVKTLGALLLIAAEYVMVSWVIDDRETFLGAAVVAFIGFTVWNLGSFQNARDHVAGFVEGDSGLVRTWSMLQDLFVGLERAFYLLDLEPAITDPDDLRVFPATIRTVTWHDVHFSFEEGRPVLRGIDMSASAGTITAIVGASGAGKSTLMSTLLRLYDPAQGRIEIDGIDLKDFAIDDLRANTAIALQKNVLFARSVADNIGYAAKAPSLEQIRVAAEVACAHEFIVTLDGGYQTELGERGSKLSTGQRQRLAIARAIVRDTPILILDEPTASLDAETEQRVLANIAAWGPDRVVFIITHRLSTIRSADQIAFLEDGAIAELGTHDDLMAIPGGRYHAFVTAELEHDPV
ncbi:MAG: ABC transporter ATP-binding protein [Pseudomonadales bacterium]|nr:ABC transporter ATP-binding protein [Pseudomonadales bacterium]MDP7594336.1 ABC transporter ATP-binding protein [Pseudomonadales bacterium]HJN52867.1 ABC transporter ATP-binding protein [Pseudomonadales bacterium]